MSMHKCYKSRNVITLFWVSTEMENWHQPLWKIGIMAAISWKIVVQEDFQLLTPHSFLHFLNIYLWEPKEPIFKVKYKHKLVRMKFYTATNVIVSVVKSLTIKFFQIEFYRIYRRGVSPGRCPPRGGVFLRGCLTRGVSA